MKRLLIVAFIAWPLTGCSKLMPMMFSLKGTPAPLSGGVVPALGQSNMECAMHPGMTPAIAFQQANPQLTVINCAVGGTGIYQWSIGGPLDDACLAKVRATGKRVVGVLWYQGEADAYNGVTTWDQKFTQLVGQWRQRWGNVPVIYAQLATHDDAVYTAPFWDTIKMQQASLHIPNSAMVKTEDLARVDEVHLTGPSSMEVGRRMASAFAAIFQGLD